MNMQLLEKFEQFRQKEILDGKGKISQEIAQKLVIEEFKKYSEKQDVMLESDFDKFSKNILKKKND